ncbi:DUF2971 domain-containing protein [Streptomyces sp. NPDC056399]|uniref:DUF2971 domain-containing protein n=1 Tax=Streptomyces sp. NPDC056399 TaxID=3345807 RepID=UPI0035D5C6B4
MPADHDSARALAYEYFSEAEMAATRWTATNDLFHYTSAQSAAAILATGRLRLSPYPNTNDLWETEPQSLGLSGLRGIGIDATFALWEELDRHLRLHAKVGCLTRDFVPSDDIVNPDAQRGWSHLALWSHYGAKYGGVCLQVDQDKLVESFLRHSGPTNFAFHGPVQYLSGQNGPYTSGHVDLGQVEHFGADAVALAYAAKNKDPLFFRKHRDWSYEAEYRLVLLNQSTDCDYVDIRDAVTGIILGYKFPAADMPQIEEALEGYPSVEVQQLRYHNRRLFCVPFEGFPPHARQSFGPTPPARLEGSLSERILALNSAETEAAASRLDAEALAHTPLEQLQDGISALESQLMPWPETHTHPASTSLWAVPEGMRRRAPGVPGETVHYERGFQCAVEHLPLQSHTLTASAVIQVLDGERLRLHALVAMEHWHDTGNEHEEVWSARYEVDASDTLSTVNALMSALTKATHDARVVFDRARGAGTQESPEKDEVDEAEHCAGVSQVDAVVRGQGPVALVVSDGS